MQHFPPILKSRRLWGLTGTAIVLYLLFFKLLANLDMSWIMPPTNQIAQTLMDVWPKMPFFAVQKEPAKNGSGQTVYYSVPTRQLTPQDLARMGVTNGVGHPAAPK